MDVWRFARLGTVDGGEEGGVGSARTQANKEGQPDLGKNDVEVNA